MVKFNITFTNSKLAANFIILASAIFGFIFYDSTVFLAGFGIGAMGLGWKQYADTKNAVNNSINDANNAENNSEIKK